MLRAARLRGAMEGLHDSVGATVQVSFNHFIGDRALDAMKAGLGESGFHAAVAEGRASAPPIHGIVKGFCVDRCLVRPPLRTTQSGIRAACRGELMAGLWEWRQL
jgi:hypothetical protein